jgi:hypothetical protein
MRGKRVDLLIVGGLWRWWWLLLLLVLMYFYFGLGGQCQPCLDYSGASQRGGRDITGRWILTRQTRDSAHASFQTAVSVSPALHTGIPLFSVLHSVIFTSSFNSFISYSTTFSRSTGKSTLALLIDYCSLLLAPCVSETPFQQPSDVQ